MDISEIEAKIRAAVEAQRAKGVRIVNRDTGSPEAGCMCPLACLETQVSGGVDERSWEAVMAALGVDLSFVDGFIDGFDARHGNKESPSYALGAKLRAEYIEGNGG